MRSLRTVRVSPVRRARIPCGCGAGRGGVAGRRPCAQRLLGPVSLHGWIRGRTRGGEGQLLPSTHTPEVIRQLAVFAPDVFCLTDDPGCEIELPRVRYPEVPGARRSLARPCGPAWRRSGDRCRAAGRLRVHLRLHRHSAAARQDLGPAGAVRARWAVPPGPDRWALSSIVATVPPQHMYGFESSVLMGLQTRQCDVCRAALLSGRHRSALAAAPAAAGSDFNTGASARAAGRGKRAAREPT